MCQEAIELSEEEWGALSSRKRNFVLPYQQLLADTNPDSPRHWLKQRCDHGKTRILESRHRDNPILFDAAKKEWTKKGEKYVNELRNLPGVLKARLFEGRWIQAEGVVYSEWDAEKHLVYRFDIPHEWPRLWSIDFGYTNPFVWQAWAIDPDDRLYRYREIYHTQRLVEDHARQILELTKDDPFPVAIICDHDAEGRATLERYLEMETTPAIKMGTKKPGIQYVQKRLRTAGDGKPRMFFLRDSVEERDRSLVDAKKPTCTEEEFDVYVYDERIKRGEEPVKENDHGMDSMRYLTYSVDCEDGVESETTTGRV